jgi:DNA-binding beta-propeller fold protein YncE
MRRSLTLPLLSIVALGAVRLVVACVSSSGQGGDAGADGAGHDGASPPPPGPPPPPPAEGGGPSDGAADGGDASDGSTQLGLLATVPLTAAPLSLGTNATTHRLYATLRGGAGIAVIDTNANTLITTIANPVDVLSNTPPLDLVQVDESANKVYVGSSGAGESTIWVIDGSNNAVTPIDITAPGHALLAPAGFALDAANGKLYVAVNDSTVHGYQVVDTNGPDAGATTFVTTDDLQVANGVALDPTNNLLFVCGSQVSTNLAAVDQIATVGDGGDGGKPQRAFTVDGTRILGCQGGPGFATMVLNTQGATPATIEMLEPATIEIDGGKIPIKYRTSKYGTLGTGERIHVFVEVEDKTTHQPEVLLYDFCGEAPAGYQHFSSKALDGNISDVVIDFTNSEVWVTQAANPTTDAGAPTAVYRVDIPGMFLPPPDAGGGFCCVQYGYSCTATSTCCGAPNAGTLGECRDGVCH